MVIGIGFTSSCVMQAIKQVTQVSDELGYLAITEVIFVLYPLHDTTKLCQYYDHIFREYKASCLISSRLHAFITLILVACLKHKTSTQTTFRSNLHISTTSESPQKILHLYYEFSAKISLSL